MSMEESDRPRVDPPRPPTVEQQRALDATVNVALASGAGCGKTRVLTDRVVLAIEAQEPLDRIVAVTFTEKAATEMRGRIRAECRRRGGLPGPESSYWRRMLRGLEAGRIGTFHGFCLDLLRRFPERAGLPPEFSILEESIAPTLRDEALRRCIRRWLADSHPDLVFLAVEMGLDAVRDGLRALLLGRALADPGRWAELSPDELIDRWRSAWISEGRPAVLGRFVDEARDGLEFLKRHPCSHPVGEDRRAVLLVEIPLLPEAQDPELSFESIREYAKVSGGGTAKDWSPSGDKDEGIPVYNFVKRFYENLRKSVDRTRASLAIDDDLTRRSAELGVRFASLAREALAEVDRLKRRRELVDFDDLLIRTRALLLDHGDELIGTLRGETDLLLVDEFQDTDPIQGAIVRALAGDDPGSGRLFLVGDSKQSIYRFRGAEPTIFSTFRDGLEREGKLALTGNFRSVPGIIHFANALFLDLYDGPDDALRAERSVAPIPDEPPNVEFLWAYETEHSARSKTSSRRVEAGWIARLIADRLDGGWQIPDEKTGKWRPAKASDFVILFRALTSVDVYEEALVHEGLDYHTLDGSAFFAQQEVLDVVNLLAAIEDPFDPLALAATLRGPFFGVSDEGLYWLANVKPGDLQQNLGRCDRIAELGPVDRRRSTRARDLLDRWRALKDRAPIATLIDRLLDESGFEAAIVAEVLGDRKRANVRKLVRLAGSYDRGGYPLADFVARLRKDLRQLAREDQAATNTEVGDAVRLMTIHRAKGLEFPVVIVPDLDRGAPPKSQAVIMHGRFGPIVRPDAEPGDERSGFAPKEKPRGLAELLYKATEERHEREEADRLFYVAATRAASHLILSNGLRAPLLRGSRDDEPADSKFYAPSSPAMERIARHFDLATGSLKIPLPEGWPAPRVNVIADSPNRQSLQSKAPRKQVDRVSIARVIAREAPVGVSDRSPAPSRPTWIEHDPEAGLSPFSARVFRMVRAVLCDPDAGWAEDLDAALRRKARATMPASTPRVVEAARELVVSWIEGPMAGRAERIDAAVERVGTRVWTVTGEEDGPDSAGVIHRGTLDLAFREGKTWRIVIFAHPQTPPGLAERRLVLSGRAAQGLGLGRIAEGWLVRLMPAPAGPELQVLDGRRFSRTIAGDDAPERPPTRPRTPTRSRAVGRRPAGPPPPESEHDDP